jgi:predicted N-acetyltransferase YhbS
MLTIQQACLKDLMAVKKLYETVKYGGGVSETDLITLAFYGEELVGAVRLCPSTDFFVLRGMQILPSFQRQGIGIRLLQTCVEHLTDKPCYCIPWSHLQSFYEQVGFQSITTEHVPVLLAERWNSYISMGMNLILMYRPA